MMEGPPLHLMISTDAKSITHHTPVPVPVHWQEEVEADLDRCATKCIGTGTYRRTCHMVSQDGSLCQKYGKPRHTIDLQILNVHASRETHHTMSPLHQACSVPPGTLKTVCVALKGYHSPTTSQRQTPHNLYHTLGQVQILHSSTRIHSVRWWILRRFNEIAFDFPNKTKCIDDTLRWAGSLEESFYRTC